MDTIFEPEGICGNLINSRNALRSTERYSFPRSAQNEIHQSTPTIGTEGARCQNYEANRKGVKRSHSISYEYRTFSPRRKEDTVIDCLRLRNDGRTTKIMVSRLPGSRQRERSQSHAERVISASQKGEIEGNGRVSATPKSRLECRSKSPHTRIEKCNRRMHNRGSSRRDPSDRHIFRPSFSVRGAPSRPAPACRHTQEGSEKRRRGSPIDHANPRRHGGTLIIGSEGAPVTCRISLGRRGARDAPGADGGPPARGRDCRLARRDRAPTSEPPAPSETIKCETKSSTKIRRRTPTTSSTAANALRNGTISRRWQTRKFS